MNVKKKENYNLKDLLHKGKRQLLIFIVFFFLYDKYGWFLPFCQLKLKTQKQSPVGKL